MITILLAGLTPMTCNAEFRDPTQPAYPLPPAFANADSGGNNNELVLSAIWISSQSRRATINGISAKQGQTIIIEPASTLNLKPATLKNTATTDDKKDKLLNKAIEHTTRPTQENIITSLLAAKIGNNNIARLQEQNAIDTSTRADKSAPTIHPTTSLIPAHSSTIKIIDIRKNSVTIDQNGVLKTLQLVQRPYKTQ